ncbi:MAG: UDP-glucose/GDP-mannose dehydrogenase family protein [Mucinivorans sp.]
MNVAIVGTGYVGLVTGTCFAEMGTRVTCIDVRADIVDKLRQGQIHIFEPGLQELVVKNINEKRLFFSTSLDEVIDRTEVIFSAVGTPPNEDGSADLQYVLQVARQVGQRATQYFVLVTKSTVPVGTAVKVRAAIQEELDRRGVSLEFDVASNPEFLKEGAAIKDFMSPDRIVIGADSDRARALLEKLYKPFMLNGERFVSMDVASAEMTKYAANAMLATRISFMNEIAGLCECVGADAEMVRRGIGSDHRIGSKFLYPGVGYGGSCFPKDIKALAHTGREYGYTMQIVEAVEQVNDRQKNVPYNKLRESLGDLRGKKIALWGLAFKPETDDIREATSEVLIRQLLGDGAEVYVYDPQAMDNMKEVFGSSIEYCNNKYETANETDAVVLVTEWREFRMADWEFLRSIMRGNLIIDGRNIYNQEELTLLGFRCVRIGRK